MTEIWRKDDGKWSTIGPSGFVNEAELHQQIVEAPELLPIAGQRRIIAPFSEVGLGGGSADVLAFTDKGRPVVIEVKLKRNNEAKRAVVAQTLGYAAYLHGVTVEELEEDILSQPQHLGGKKLADVIGESDANGIDRDEFYENLAQHLAEGSFRLVIVLDEAPEYLVRLMGYLETITTDRISIDLVTVSAYEVNGAQILVPQRIDPEREPEREAASVGPTRRRSKSNKSEGSRRFREIAAERGEDEQAALIRIADWVDDLAAEELCRVQTVEAKTQVSLRPRLMDQDTPLAHFTTSIEPGKEPWAWLFGPFARAPESTDLVWDVAGKTGGGAAVTDELLEALAEAYREALTTEPKSEFARDSSLFRESLVALSEERRQRLTELADWADGLKQEDLCRVESFRGKSGRFTLLMRLPGKKAGFSVIWNEVGASGWEGVMTLNRSVIERHAPGTLPRIEAIAGRVGQGTNAEPTPDLLDALADAYREATGR